MFDRRGNRKYLNGVERQAFLQSVRKEPDELRRAFCLVLFYTGCRISEALNVTAARIDPTEGTIVFETLKQRKKGCFRSVPVPDDVIILLRQIVGKLDASSRIWDFSRTTGYRLIKWYLAQAGIQGGMASPKGLRHGFAVACIGKKIPLTTIKKWMGHARLTTTMIYLEVTGDEERELAERLWSADGKKPEKTSC
ncbi:MAG TPA: site-specific integrase [Verrucomicrobiae bacterium]|nr:site-specific integrase [Verrucomicrobiae bacterium]